jgi:S-adenosylmethionine:tRNA ribosyltransferase-isomerase
MNGSRSSVADFRYELPPERIAQTPTPDRDQSRLLVLRRADDSLAHRSFHDLTAYLRAGDLLVLNDTRVLRARLRGLKSPGGGRLEILLGHPIGTNDWWCLLRPGKRVRPGTRIEFSPAPGPEPLAATVLAKDEQGLYRLVFTGVDDVLDVLDRIGEVPLPPYIARAPGSALPTDIERYQTVYAETPGAVAAPTAGLHFTPALLAKLESLGVELCRVTLHVGLGTFAPIQSLTVEEHVMHSERFELKTRAADQLNTARAAQRRVVAVGTTVVRVLEHVAAQSPGRLVPIMGETRLFIHPPFRFQVVDALITNFHLPESTLLMLVSAFADPGGLCGRDRILSAYAEAIRERYRFFSYGDAMLIL